MGREMIWDCFWKQHTDEKQFSLLTITSKMTEINNYVDLLEHEQKL